MIIDRHWIRVERPSVHSVAEFIRSARRVQFPDGREAFWLADERAGVIDAESEDVGTVDEVASWFAGVEWVEFWAVARI